MALTFTLRTVERLRVPSPWDPAVPADHRAALLAWNVAAIAGVVWPDGVTLFEVRGLSPTEIRQLAPFTPPFPGPVADHYDRRAVDKTAKMSAEAADHFDVWWVEQGIVYLRAGLEAVIGLPGWPEERERHLGLRLWPAKTLDGLPVATLRWLARGVHDLSALSPEKKRPAGGSDATPSGPTAASTGRASGASGSRAPSSAARPRPKPTSSAATDRSRRGGSSTSGPISKGASRSPSRSAPTGSTTGR